MSTHNICLRGAIRKLFTLYPLFSRPMIKYIFYIMQEKSSYAIYKRRRLIVACTSAQSDRGFLSLLINFYSIQS